MNRSFSSNVGYGLLLALLSLGGCASGSGTQPLECRTTDNCPPGTVCSSGQCTSGMDSGMCPDGQVLRGGECVPVGMRCRTNDDCENGRCVDGECFSNDCTEDAERACETACGGTQRCRNGVWRPCPQAQPNDICGDGRDNDCDGQSDEGCGDCSDGEERDCSTACGTGTERCAGGSWRGCTAPRPRSEICGNMQDDDCDMTNDEGCDDCTDGDQRECETECGVGTETCVDSNWVDCTARVPAPEICDGMDNDCDERTDEEAIRDCSNACGIGTETCGDGTWAGCTAPENCPCAADAAPDVQRCGICGQRSRTCGGGQWGAWGGCDEGTPNCQPGEFQDSQCGNCGARRRLCTAECEWGDWTACNNEGMCQPGSREEVANECGGEAGVQTRFCDAKCDWQIECNTGGPNACGTPGQVEEEACGNCGIRRRTCTDCCLWSEWSACDGQGECTAGDEDAEGCPGNCSVRVRACNDQCQWGEFGECSNGGQCVPGEPEMRDCGNCGSQNRVCGNECIWGEWDECQSAGECAPGEIGERACGDDVGECRAGTEQRTCDGACSWNDWGACRDQVGPADEICGNLRDEDCDGEDRRVPDEFEDNNSCDTCFMLNNGEPDPSNLELRATIDSIGDQDYYCFNADDTRFNPLENIDIELTEIPNGSDYELLLFKGLEACRAGDHLEQSRNGGNDDEVIRFAEGFNDPDGGLYIVKVYAFNGNPELNLNSCFESYRLFVDGLY